MTTAEKISFFEEALEAEKFNSSTDHIFAIELMKHIFSNPHLVRNEKGQTLLHYTAAYGNLDLVNFLIEKKCDINIFDNDGLTPLMMCGRRQRRSTKSTNEVMSLLLDAGAEINAKDNQGKTAFFYACEIWNIDAINTLLKFGANAQDIDLQGNTAFFYLAKKLYKDYYDDNVFKVIDFLCNETKIDINATNNARQTILHAIADHGSLRWFNVYKYLCEKGANPDIVDTQMKTPLDLVMDEDPDRHYWGPKAKNWELWKKLDGLVKMIGAAGMVTLCASIYYYFSDKD